ncbi:Hypothetical predicted protein, partial [Pelobates cultripes]
LHLDSTDNTQRSADIHLDLSPHGYISPGSAHKSGDSMLSDDASYMQEGPKIPSGP